MSLVQTLVCIIYFIVFVCFSKSMTMLISTDLPWQHVSLIWRFRNRNRPIMDTKQYQWKIDCQYSYKLSQLYGSNVCKPADYLYCLYKQRPYLTANSIDTTQNFVLSNYQLAESSTTGTQCCCLHILLWIALPAILWLHHVSVLILCCAMNYGQLFNFHLFKDFALIYIWLYNEYSYVCECSTGLHVYSIFFSSFGAMQMYIFNKERKSMYSNCNNISKNCCNITVNNIM